MFQKLTSLPFFYFMLIFIHVKSQQCTVTQTVKFDDCILYCWNKYDGKKDFYDFSTGNCSQQVTCGPGYYRDYQKNICIDQFGGYILKDLGYVFKVKQQRIMRFVKIIFLEGYIVGNKLICKDGWKSSMKTQKKSNISIIVYLCDEELKDGQIYPKTHGEYFFEKLSLQQKVYVMDTVLGTDDLSKFFTLKVNIFIVFTSIYLFLNLIACCTSKSTKKSSSCCWEKKNKGQNKKLSESQENEIKQFLQKRKQENLQKMKNLKCFSLKDQIDQQLSILKNLKIQKEQKQKKRWLRKYEQKQKAKKQKQNQRKQKVKK